MAIDITYKILGEVFRGSDFSDDDTSIIKWLVKNVGPTTTLPDMEVVPTGTEHRIYNCGVGWVIDYQNIRIINPSKREEHNVGLCAPLGPWQPSITTSQYRLHIADETLAVQFKLRWM
jgi:hypothetical protein